VGKDKTLKSAVRIWSPPFLQGLCVECQGQDCCRISGLLVEAVTPPGLNDFRSYCPNRVLGLYGPANRSGFQYAGLTCFVITFVKAFAILGGSSPSLPSVPLCQYSSYLEVG